MTGKRDTRRADAGGDRRTLDAILGGYQAAALLYVAARLGLADLLADGPRESAELARAVGAHAPSLYRILRGLVVVGVFREEGDGRFALSELGRWLTTDAPRSMRGPAVICGEEYLAAWGALLHSATTGETAFRHAFGMSQWEHRRLHPELGEYFDRDLDRETAGIAEAIVQAYDFSAFGTVADIGGGRGALLAAALKASPSTSGILFDRGHVVEAARPLLEAEGVASRCRLVAGDFFESVPEGADAHILKSVIHDWNDEHSLAILSNCRKALVAKGRLLLVERLLPERAEDDRGTIMVDLQMLAVTGGRERTEAEYRALLEAAGFRLTRVVATHTPFRIIEAAPV